jgi:FKBP-type peptidyl-prolyl cis-trans isomerase FkpA
MPRLLRATVAVIAVALSACSDSSTSTGTPSNPATETYASSLSVNIASMTKKSDNLYYQDLVVGTGAEAISGRRLGMTYSGWLANGTPFDSNVGGENFVFNLGGGQVIAGWDQGIVGMKVGGRRRLVIGSALGYGTRGQGAIPPNATLVFVVELKTLQ